METRYTVVLAMLGLALGVTTAVILLPRSTTPQTDETRELAKLEQRAADGDLEAVRKLHARASPRDKPYLALEGALLGDRNFGNEYFGYFQQLSETDQRARLEGYRRIHTGNRADCIFAALASKTFNEQCFEPLR